MIWVPHYRSGNREWSNSSSLKGFCGLYNEIQIPFVHKNPEEETKKEETRHPR